MRQLVVVVVVVIDHRQRLTILIADGLGISARLH